MPKITFIIGLPASGKTTLAKTIGGSLFEDAKDMPLGVEGDFILESPEFCLTNILNSARMKAIKEYPWHSHNLIFFKNSPDKCLVNGYERNKVTHKSVGGFIKYLSERYAPPKDAIDVYELRNNNE